MDGDADHLNINISQDRLAGWVFGSKEAQAMPKRTDIKRILVIGSGPIVIGQACEFDFTPGAQALQKVLKGRRFTKWCS